MSNGMPLIYKDMNRFHLYIAYIVTHTHAHSHTHIHTHTHTHTHTHIFSHTHTHVHTHSLTHTYIHTVYLGSMSLFKHVLLETGEYFLFRRSSLLIIFLMSWSRWWRKRPILANALSTILLGVLRGYVGLIFVVSFVLFCFFISKVFFNI